MWSQSTCTERAAPLGLAALLSLWASSALAQDWEKLVMPGEVVEGHASFETDCGQCHRPFRRHEQRDLCLSCHDHADVARDVRAGEGFHGRVARSGECSVCHTEHEGRAADIVGLDPETFDHGRTDYELHGRHRSVPCASCHEGNAAYRAAPSRCADCHGEHDPHRGRLGEDCGQCHDASAWKAASFDHDKTEFPLVGEHRQVACTSCHPGNRYENTGSDCASCHQLRDVHGGRLGKRCESCHTSGGWKRATFDHERETGFALRGAHGRLRCESCHQSSPYEVELQQSCYSCHQVHDEHKGRFGRKCDTCHGERSWKDEKFDHQSTGLPLRGAHESVSCTACHKGVLSEVSLETACQACHRADDPHSGQEGQDCARCHRESGWTEQVFFDHGLTRFPLLGLHAAATCEDCHASRKFRDAEERCAACHARDDFHERRLGSDCALCHNPNGWRFWKFDHDKQTEFALDGAHAELRCHDCHASPVRGRISQSTACGSCHAADDVHLGSYGANCARCHATTDWRHVQDVR